MKMAHGILIHFADFNSKSFRNNCPTAFMYVNCERTAAHTCVPWYLAWELKLNPIFMNSS